MQSRSPPGRKLEDMKLETFGSDWILSPCDALVLAIDDDWRNRPVVQQLSQATGGWLASVLESGEVSTKPNKVSLLYRLPQIATPLLALVGIGCGNATPAFAYARAAGAAVRAIMNRKRGTVRFVMPDLSPLELRSAIAGAIAGCVGQDLYRSEHTSFEPDVMQWVGGDAAELRSGQILGDAINLTRRLVNLPPNVLDPNGIALEASRLATTHGLGIEIWDRAKLERERCGALLGVARGSIKEPRLVILRYSGDPTGSAPIALVGKGVTFDSGGYSIKPTDGMLTMKCDMAGAATVLGILDAASGLRVKRNLVGILGCVENLISGDAFKLGDVLTARSGKTIEIHNTDAEGRLVLADCLNVALDERPASIIDFATLTGACVVALGNDVAGIMSNHSDLQTEILSASERCGEYVWPLPMHPHFSELIAGKVADIKNVGDGRWGGAITAAKFLEEFVDGRPWAHLDIAGPAFADSPKPWCDAGGTGFLVRSFVEWLAS